MSLTLASVRGMRCLTNEEMQPFLQQPFGAAVLHVVQERAWESMARQIDACTYLSRRCFLCGLHFGRIQELNAHFRQQHADLWHGVPEKAIQLSNLYGHDSPCDCCGSLFKTHVCPVFTQLAVMLLHGAALDEPDMSSATLAARHRCELCLEVFNAGADLAQHLQTAHQLQGLSFNESRDVIPGSTACVHCGIIFQTVDGVKSHVVQGRCAHFDPRATAETLEVPLSLKQACIEGTLHRLLASPMERQRLTLRCQLCGKVYQRAADLAGHLQAAHSRLWRQAQRLTQVLVALIYAPGQCCCNPSIGTKRGAHVCIPLRQLAMSFHRLKQEPFAPVVISDDTLDHVLPQQLDREGRFRLERILSSRQFDFLWQDSGLTRYLSTHCLQCGLTCAPADLCLHLREAHLCSHTFITFYMEEFVMLLHSLNEEDHQCSFCQQIFNLPSHMDVSDNLVQRFDLVQSHFKGHCPFALQLATLFASILNGGRFEHAPSGHSGISPDSGNLPALDAHVGQRPETRAQPERVQASQVQRQGRRRRSLAGQGRGSNKRFCRTPPASADSPGDSTRPGTELAAKKRLFRPLLQQTSGRHSADFDARGPELAQSGTETGQPSPERLVETAPDEEHAKGAHGPPSEDLQCQGDGRSPQSFGDKRPDSPGQVLAIPSVEPGDKILGSQQAHPCFDGENAPACGGASRDGLGCEPDCTVQRPSSAERQPHSSMEVAGESTLRHSVRAASSFEQQHGVDSGWLQHEATFPSSIESGQSASGADRRQILQGQRQGPPQGLTPAVHQVGNLTDVSAVQLIPIVTELIMQNSSNWCYANCATYCIIWIMLCLHNFSAAEWGSRFVLLIDFLQRHRSEVAVLENEQWFRQILDNWGQALGQQDCAEFLHAMLEWMAPPAFDMRWERRSEIAGTVHVEDSHTQYLPINLQFDLQLLSQTSCSIADFVSIWRQVDGLPTGLTQAPQALCVHIGRINSNQAGEIVRSDCSVELDSEVQFPFFKSFGLEMDEAGYTPVAAAAHLGSDLCGHYRAALKLSPSLKSLHEPVRWMLTEDSCRPATCWHLPEWFKQQITVVLLVRKDCLKLPLYVQNNLQHHRTECPPSAPNATAGMDNSTAALLQLLANLPRLWGPQFC